MAELLAAYKLHALPYFQAHSQYMQPICKLQHAPHKPHPNTWSHERARTHTSSTTQKFYMSKWCIFFSCCCCWVRKTSLKGGVACHQQRATLCVKPLDVFFLEFLFKPSQVLHGFSWLCGYQFVPKKGPLVLPSHPASLDPKIITQKLLITTLLDPLALTSYWLTHTNITHLH